MKVSDLIAILWTLEQDLEIRVLFDGGYGHYEDIMVSIDDGPGTHVEIYSEHE